MENKKTKIIIISIVLCILILITIGAIYYFNVVSHNNSDDSTNNYKENPVSETFSIQSPVVQTPTAKTEQKENENTQIKKVNKLDESKEIVYSSYEITLANQYSYKIPYININLKNIDTINNEIEKYYKTDLEEVLAEYQSIEKDNKFYTLSIMEIKYNAYINNNILSLVIETLHTGGLKVYKVYNVDIYDGTVIENLDLIKLKQVKESDLENKLKELYKAKFIEEYGTKDDVQTLQWPKTEIQERANFYDEQLQLTISSSNCSAKKVPMFLNANGNICVVANIYAMDGGESYNHIIEVII